MRFTYLVSTILSLGLTGCAVTSGLQTYTLPNDQSFQTDLGTSVQLQQITQQTISNLNSQPHPQLLQSNLGNLFDYQPSTYHLSKGDILSIQLWAYPEITPPINAVSSPQSIQSIGYRIDQSGYIQFPLVGRIKAEGYSLNQFNTNLSRKLSAYLKNPDAVTRVLSYEGQPYSVQGNVLKGGQYFLNDQPLSIYAAIGQAGGLGQEGDNTAVQLIRDGVVYDLNPVALEKLGLSLHRLFIKKNDTIYVNSRENQKVYVMGEAAKNVAIPMRAQGMTLSDVLGESLGLNPISASAQRIYVLRNDLQTQSTQLYHMDLTNFADFGLANQFAMQSNDIVYVDASGLARWQRVVTQMLPFSNALYNFDRLGN